MRDYDDAPMIRIELEHAGRRIAKLLTDRSSETVNRSPRRSTCSISVESCGLRSSSECK